MKTTVSPSNFTEVIVTAKHSNVFYIHKKDTGFEAVEKATAYKNAYKLDLFKYNGAIYEGRSGFKLVEESGIDRLNYLLISDGGIEKFNSTVDKNIADYGESPRYTRPHERKKDIFPPDPEKENTILAKDCFGKKHYYYRFYNENGITLYNLKNDKDAYRTIFVECEGYMLGVGQYTGLEKTIIWLAGLENGIKGEVERRFNESLENPNLWADIGFANILGRVDEADAHNAPILEAREREREQQNAEHEAKRIAEEQAEKAEYEQAIKEAESKILNKQTVINSNVLGGKSLILQLFREHNITIPLKTQGWIINALADIHYSEKHEEWSYNYYVKSKNSTVFFDYLPLLVAAVKTKQQYEEITCPLDGDTENDCGDCVYAGDYHFQDGECVQRGDDENDNEM